MLDVAFAIPGDISLPTGGYVYARKILDLLPDHGVVAHHMTLPAAYPYPREEDLERTRHIFGQVSPGTLLMVDGLAFGAMPPELVDQIQQRIVALVHHPLAYETGITQANERLFRAFETHALGTARHVVTSSHSTATLLTHEFDVPEARITVAEPGTAPAVRAHGAVQGKPFALLAVGSLIPRKGYDILIDALKKLEHLDWHLNIVGALDRDIDCLQALREQILKTGLRSRITLAGSQDERELQKFYVAADLFVMSSHYEGYGMVLTEALSHGLPIVCTTGGAMAQTAPDDAAVKVRPGDAGLLAEALESVITNAELRQRLADKAWLHASQLPRWDNTAATIASTLKNVDRRTSGGSIQ